MKIPLKHRRQLDEQGYVIIPDVLSDAEIADYRATLSRLAEQERADGSGRVACIRRAGANMCGGW